jgi:hypothetical protein
MREVLSLPWLIRLIILAEDDGEIEERSTSYQRVRRELLDAERNAVVGLRRSGYINDDVMKRVQRDIDLEAARLDVPG